MKNPAATDAAVATYASRRAHPARLAAHPGSECVAYINSDPGEADLRPKHPITSPTSVTASVAKIYTSHVPFPASANTSGIVIAGVAVGAIADTDCASVSHGPSTCLRSP